MPLSDDKPSEPVLVEHLKSVREAEHASYHMPGHKGGAGTPPAALDLFGPAVYEADLSELAGFDYLHGASTAIAVAQARTARLMGAQRTWFLVNGASVGNIAAICATVVDGDPILVARGSHRSVYAGLALSGARPVYLEAVRNDGLDGLFGIDPESVEDALHRNRQIRAIHVTSPSYYGFTVDVDTISHFAAAAGVPLIVDEAHGTHFAFHPHFPRPALADGVDVVVHSPHKTLGSLTQSSMIHHQGHLADAARLDAQLQMLQSSSPSSLLLVSLDAALHDMGRNGRAKWGRALELATRAREEIRAIPGITCYGDEIAGTPGIFGFDPTKLVVDVHGLWETGHAAGRWLREHARINPEFADLRRMVFSITTGDTDESVDRLVAALRGLAAAGRPIEEESLVASAWPDEIPEMAMTPREGAAATSTLVPAADAVGRVSAEMIVPYPPGIPLLVAGELVSEEVMESMSQLIDAGCRMVGMTDPTGATLRCVDDDW